MRQWRFRIIGHAPNRTPMLALRVGPWKLPVDTDHDRFNRCHVPSEPMELHYRARDERAFAHELAERVMASPPGPTTIPGRGRRRSADYRAHIVVVIPTWRVPP